jgi:hypothetical protein
MVYSDWLYLLYHGRYAYFAAGTGLAIGGVVFAGVAMYQSLGKTSQSWHVPALIGSVIAGLIFAFSAALFAFVFLQ